MGRKAASVDFLLFFNLDIIDNACDLSVKPSILYGICD